MSTSLPSSPSRVLRGRWVFPVSGDPIPNGFVATAQGQIVSVGRERPPGDVEDLGNVAIVPGFVNAHTHLEFSDLESPLGRPGMALFEWIGEVIGYRDRDDNAPRRAVSAGLEESLARGTTTLGEVAQLGWHPDLFDPPSPQATLFFELIALDLDATFEAMALARQHLNLALAARHWSPGLCLHAPYSVHPVLVKQAVALAQAESVPVAMHLAESKEELEFLQTGTGPLFDKLPPMKAWDPIAVPKGRRPLDYLRMLAPSHRAMVIHGNYLDEEEIAFLAGHAERMAVVYCPRTHAYFEHDDYPLAGLLAAGATVGLGTDSRASSPNLSVLAEMRLVAQRHPGVPLDTVLRLGTIHGARALGLDRRIGSLEPGKQADLAVVALPDGDAADPHELLFQSDLPVVATSLGKRVANG